MRLLSASAPYGRRLSRGRHWPTLATAVTGTDPDTPGKAGRESQWTTLSAMNESGLGSSADGEGEEGIDRSFERAGTPLHLGE